MYSKKSHNLIKIKTNQLVDTLFAWNYRTSFSWKWIEFDWFKEYSWNNDAKDIDWVTSTRENKILSRKYIEERELDIYFVFDLDESFLESFNWEKKLNVLLEFLYLIWYSAIKSWDKIWSYSYNTKNLFYPKKWKINLENIIKNINLDKDFFNKINFSDTNSKQWKKDNFMLKKSLVFYITWDIVLNNKDIKKLSRYNDLIVVNIFNYFENNLNWNWVIWLKSWKEKLFIDLDNKKQKNKYKKLRIENIDKFKKEIHKYKARYLYLDTKTDIFREILKLMK